MHCRQNGDFQNWLAEQLQIWIVSSLGEFSVGVRLS